MKAAVIESVGRAVVAEVPDPTPGPREVVVEVAACGLCGTDLHILQGEFAPKLPIVPGHEFAGEVVGVGTRVTELAIGDRVAVDPSLYCYECRYCRTGHNNLCERWAAIGVTTAGGAAQYATAPVFLTGFITSQGLFLAKVCAASLVVSLPVLAAGFAAQDKLVQGLSLGAVK